MKKGHQTGARSGDHTQPTPEWVEDGNCGRLFAEFALNPDSGAPAPLTAHCMITAGASTPDSEALCVGLDLLLSLPMPSAQHDGIPEKSVIGEKLTLHELVELAEIVTRSAIRVAKAAASELLGIRPDDGHLAV